MGPKVSDLRAVDREGIADIIGLNGLVWLFPSLPRLKVYTTTFFSELSLNLSKEVILLKFLVGVSLGVFLMDPVLEA
jgi:hypothetical protein